MPPAVVNRFFHSVIKLGQQTFYSRLATIYLREFMVSRLCLFYAVRFTITISTICLFLSMLRVANFSSLIKIRVKIGVENFVPKLSGFLSEASDQGIRLI